MKSQRQLITFGIFSPRHWPRKKLPEGVDPVIYSALKKAGFRETIWQYVFKDQCAGLILLTENNRLELHVRFYANGKIDAELETKRWRLGHFFEPRHSAELQVLELIRPYLSNDQFSLAQGCFNLPT